MSPTTVMEKVQGAGGGLCNQLAMSAVQMQPRGRSCIPTLYLTHEETEAGSSSEDTETLVLRCAWHSGQSFLLYSPGLLPFMCSGRLTSSHVAATAFLLCEVSPA